MHKKIGILLVCFFVGSIGAYAQSGFRIGVNAGPTFSRAGTSIDSLPDHFKSKTNIGYNLGLQIHYGFSNSLGIETGFQFVHKGYSVKNDTNSVEEILKSNMNDIEIPICLTLRQELNSYSYMREKVGVSLGMHTESNEVLQHSAADNANFGVTENFSKTLYPMFNLGLEYGYLTDNGNAILVGLNYSQGLGKNVGLTFHNNNNHTGNLFDLNYRGSQLTLRISYLFNLSNIGSEDVYYFD